MSKTTIQVDVISNGVITPRKLIAEETPDNEMAIARSLVVNEDLVSKANPLPTTTGLNLPAYDYASANPHFDNTIGTTTIAFRVGGANGTLVALITLEYDGAGNLISVSKSLNLDAE